jgi:hypothetical protein
MKPAPPVITTRLPVSDTRQLYRRIFNEMRVLTWLALAVALALAGVASASSAGTTALRIVYYEDGAEPETRIVYTLRCDPVGGNHPKRTAACRELRRLGWRTLRPVPPDLACTEIYGGPSTAIVAGAIDGRRVWAKLRRTNGCEIDRWNRNWFILPVAVS